jgi:hypothetical protein
MNICQYSNVDHNTFHLWNLNLEPQGWSSTHLTASHPTCCVNNLMFILFTQYFISTLHETSNLIIHILLIICPNEKNENLFISFLQQCTQLYFFLKCKFSFLKKKNWIILLNNISMTILWKILIQTHDL